MAITPRHARTGRSLETLARTSSRWLFGAGGSTCSGIAAREIGSETRENQIVVLLSQSGNFAVS